MEDFSFYDELISLSENKQNEIQNKNDNKIENDKDCKHENKNTDKGIIICMDCGQELEENLSSDKEWRYYGQNDNKYNSDPNRVQIRKSEEKNIYPDLEGLGFSEVLIDEADKLYTEITRGKILRGNSRKSVILGCIFHAYKKTKNPQTIDNLIKNFGIERKRALKGLKSVGLKIPKSYRLGNNDISTINLIKEIVSKFDGNEEQVKQICDIYEKLKDKIEKLKDDIKNKPEKLNKCRPQSVASSIVYYWILKNKKNISCKEFAEKVELSEITINKIVKEIKSILETESD